ncbi:MAG TPA: bifunctional DNA primase/polymerase [Phenylobacterium sp.]
MTLLSAALSYAERGWPIFPCHPERRTPLVPRDRDALGREVSGTGGVKKASTDHAVVAAWWAKWPDASIVAAAGAPIGALVLDVDVKTVDGRHALAVAEDEHGNLPETWEARTPSGGLHLYFAMPTRHTRNRVGFIPGVDVRTTGGSITLPPSRRAAGAYRWVRSPDSELATLPKWMLDLIAPPTQPRRAILAREPISDRYARAALERECEAVAGTPSGSGRNHRLFLAAARIGELVAAEALSKDQASARLTEAAYRCGLHTDDGGPQGIVATIESGMRRGLETPREIRPRADLSPAMRQWMARNNGEPA